MSALTLTIDFGLLPVGDLPKSISIGGFSFTSLGAAPEISDRSGERGYAFPDAGVETFLPALVAFVDMRFCTKASAIDVEAVNSMGAVIARGRIAAGTARDIRLLAADIATVRAVGGSGEASLVRISVSVDVC